MSALWGDDDYQWGAYLKWQRRRLPIWPFVLLGFTMAFAAWCIWRITFG